MKGNTDCHIPNDKYRENFDRIFRTYLTIIDFVEDKTINLLREQEEIKINEIPEDQEVSINCNDSEIPD